MREKQHERLMSRGKKEVITKGENVCMCVSSAATKYGYQFNLLKFDTQVFGCQTSAVQKFKTTIYPERLNAFKN